MGQNSIAVRNNSVKVNGSQTGGQVLNNGDYIETDGTGLADINSDAQKAATVSGATPTNIYVVPPNSLTRVYYNNSYRYQLTTPNGYVGIRG